MMQKKSASRPPSSAALIGSEASPQHRRWSLTCGCVTASLAVAGWGSFATTSNEAWAGNHLGTYGRWAFAEFTDVYQIGSDFEARVESEFNQMIDSVAVQSV